MGQMMGPLASMQRVDGNRVVFLISSDIICRSYGGLKLLWVLALAAKGKCLLGPNPCRETKGYLTVG